MKNLVCNRGVQHLDLCRTFACTSTFFWPCSTCLDRNCASHPRPLYAKCESRLRNVTHVEFLTPARSHACVGFSSCCWGFTRFPPPDAGLLGFSVVDFLVIFFLFLCLFSHHIFPLYPSFWYDRWRVGAEGTLFFKSKAFSYDHLILDPWSLILETIFFLQKIEFRVVQRNAQRVDFEKCWKMRLVSLS